MTSTIKLVKVELPEEPQAERRKRWSSLHDAIFHYTNIDRPFRLCQQRKLELVINTLKDGRVVVSIAGSIGAARSLQSAFRRAAKAYDKATKPKKSRRKKR